MKQIVLISSIAVLLAACGSGKKEGNAAINDKKAELEKLKSEKGKTDDKIRQLQAELESIDSATANAAKVKLVGISPVSTQDFRHYIDLHGKVDAENISYISPRMGPAQVKAVYVHEGQAVKKGQLLLKLDDAIIRQQIAAVKQQQDGIKTQLAFAKNLAQRQQNLWDQGIGTEVQLITAKTNVENLENQLKSVGEQVKVVVEQLNTTNVYSDVAGIADIVNIRVGETFQGMMQGANGPVPQIKIVNTNSLKVTSNIPENYLTHMQKGTPVEITIPDLNNKNISSKISLISQSIDPTMRGFIAEAKIPYDPALKPNQSAIMRIMDVEVKNTVVIPVNTVQTDENGKYVFVMEKQNNNRVIAKKKTVLVGEVYGDSVQIKSGLNAGDALITEGYQNLYDGQLINTKEAGQ